VSKLNTSGSSSGVSGMASFIGFKIYVPRGFLGMAALSGMASYCPRVLRP